MSKKRIILHIIVKIKSQASILFKIYVLSEQGLIGILAKLLSQIFSSMCPWFHVTVLFASLPNLISSPKRNVSLKHWRNFQDIPYENAFVKSICIDSIYKNCRWQKCFASLHYSALLYNAFIQCQLAVF